MTRNKRKLIFAVVCLAGTCLFACIGNDASAQSWLNTDDDERANRSAFRVIDEWPDPNDYRTAAGAPGHRYWQQRVDYVIETELDTTHHACTGSERITYYNNSPEVLRYLWFQLDQNVRSLTHSRTYQSQPALPADIHPAFLQLIGLDNFDGGFELIRIQVEGNNGDLIDTRYIINNTVMKVYLPEPLEPGSSTHLEIDWRFNVHTNGSRGGREKVSDGWIYEMAQWYPRLSVYDDVNGWQTDQFLGRGEFYLQFGDYDVKITVPHDHIVEATGVLQNPDAVLTRTQLDRLEQAYESEEPMFIISADEVQKPETRPVHSGSLTWHYKAENVRDFAWASSKTFVWDAAGFRYRSEEKPIALHSFYPREGIPLWDRVSTRAIRQTMITYGAMSFEYPYPKAVNVMGPAFGMEYPMMAFCGSRPLPDGRIPETVENTLIFVTIHEVGHNWFPMIVASDERKWAWMDEGLNSFLQYYGEQAWDPDFPSQWGPAPNIVPYMRIEDQMPIMTTSDLISEATYLNNAYAKAAAGLVILRERILGPERFDDAFREYAELWAFKHPQPSDFFRTMEEAAGEDLAWFWRGWFYSTHVNDQAVTNVTTQSSEELVGTLERGGQYYRTQIENKGGIVMPVEVEITFDDGTTGREILPVEIWKTNERVFTKGLFSDKRIIKVVLDPDEAFADVDRENNIWEASTVEEGEEVNE